MTTEEEEIDIISFDGLSSKQEREISKISSGQILSCDYTVHPRWLDNADTTDLWNDNHHAVDCRQIFTSSDRIPELENCDEVTANENKLIFEKDIPTLNEEEVITNSLEKDYNCDLIDYKNELKVYIHPRSVKHDAKSIPKHVKNTPTATKKSQITKNIIKDVKRKGKKELNANDNKNKQGKLLRKLLKSNKSRKKVIPKLPKTQTLKKIRKSYNLKEKNVTINHEREKNILGPVKDHPTITFGEIVNVIQNDTESDLEVDVESDDDLPPVNPPSFPEIVVDTPVETYDTEVEDPCVEKPVLEIPKKSVEEDYIQLFEKLKTENVKLYEQMHSLESPTQELNVLDTEISEIEQFVHSEFFEGRPTKTRDRYLKIRNYILKSWRTSKPNYLSKTVVRGGLKNCGDVHCISRIHSLLEQIGAINFSSAGNNFEFIRPLTLLVKSFNQSKTKVPGSTRMERLPRTRNVSSNCVQNVRDGNMNFTIEHRDGVEVRVIAANNQNKFRAKAVKSELDLVKCVQISNDNLAPFKVSISLSTLLCLQLHSLSSTHEIMGFLGGHHDKCGDSVTINLTCYRPCLTSSQSLTMCEMCPVSQTEQSLKLLSEGYNVLGWFHSHPMFLPNPSRTDLKSQAEMQMQYSSNGIPFIGFIMSCLDMSFKCFYMQAKDLSSSIENGLPCELQVQIVRDIATLTSGIKDVLDVIGLNNFKDIVNKFCDKANYLLCEHEINLNMPELIASLY